MSDDSWIDVVSYSDEEVCDYEFHVAMTEFSTNVQENFGTRSKVILDKDLIFLESFEILFYANGCNLKNQEFVSTLFLENKKSPLSSEFVSYTFSCIMSVIDNDGRSRFPQSFAVSRCAGIDEANDTNPYTPFGLERFLDCRTIVDNFEELISEDKLTISLHISLVLRYKVESKHSRNIFYNMKCDDNIESVQGTDGTTKYKLSFGTPLFFFLKNMSRYFRRIAETPMLEAGPQSMFICADECTAFHRIAIYVSTGSLRHVEDLHELVQLYTVADKYGILRLRESCSENLKSHMSHENATDILILADRHSDKILRTTAIRYIRIFLPEVMSTDGWSHLVTFRKDLVEEVLESSEVIERELPVAESATNKINDYEVRECCEQLNYLEISSYFS